MLVGVDAVRRGRVGGRAYVMTKQAQAVLRVEEAKGERKGQEREQAGPEGQGAPDHRRASRGDFVQVCGPSAQSTLWYLAIRVHSARCRLGIIVPVALV